MSDTPTTHSSGGEEALHGSRKWRIEVQNDHAVHMVWEGPDTNGIVTVVPKAQAAEELGEAREKLNASAVEVTRTHQDRRRAEDRADQADALAERYREALEWIENFTNTGRRPGEIHERAKAALEGSETE